MPIILGIETSCDETAAAVVDQDRRVRSNIVASQHELHERYGGVVPEIASRAHLERIEPVMVDALHEAGVTWSDIDAVAVGNRPGLIGSLLVGVSAAQALAWSLDKPLIGIDHVQAHLYAAFLRGSDEQDRPESLATSFPALGLVVSGGHTSLYHMDGFDDLQPIGRTIDDAVGEAYDKAAVILDVGYPGGPTLDRLAQTGDPSICKLPRSMLGNDSLDFSFSGLKTALLYQVRGKPQGRGRDAGFQRSAADLTPSQRADLAAAFQAAAIDALIRKLDRALTQWQQQQDAPPRAIVLGGGVSANSLLRQRVTELANTHSVKLHLPALPYCVDNAAMIAGLAHQHLQAGRVDDLDLPAIATTAC